MLPGESQIAGSNEAAAAFSWAMANAPRKSELQGSEAQAAFLGPAPLGQEHSSGARTGLSILIPTYNRRAVLAKTLEAIERSDMTGLQVEIVVIDSNGTDNISDCVASFSGRLPLVCLRETRPGKNRALNKALKECRLLDLVVFVDDDITPRPDWLQNIAAASERWPNIAVFGARVNVGWPQGAQPRWARAEWIRVFGFAWHDLGEEDRSYGTNDTPMGPCFWLRKRGFPVMPLFDENIGPRPTNRIMGGEVSFLLRLQRRGIEMIYCPSVEVEHRIAPEECSVGALRRRAFRCGRGDVRIFGLHRRRFFEKNRFAWAGLLVVEACIYSGIRLVGSLVHPLEHRRVELALRAMTRLGCVLESIRVGLGKTE